MTGTPIKIWTIFVLIVFSTLLISCNQVETFEHEIQVQAADTGEPISNAAVRAEMGTRGFVEGVSNADGITQLAIDEAYRDAWAKVIVEADNYQKQSFLVELVAENPSTVVEMQPLGAETPAEQPAAEAAPTGEADTEVVSHDDNAAIDTVEPQATAHNDAMASENSVSSPGELANIPPAERANFYQAKPELTVDTTGDYQATIQTSKGDIVVSLNAAAAPEHVNNFIFLSGQGFYDGLTFHRVEPGFVIQGGDPEGTGQGGPGYTVPGEFELKHVEGALAMARLPDQINPDRESSGSQFYITLAPTEFLDGQYSVFGKVEEGLDVVQSIEVGDVIEHIIVEP